MALNTKASLCSNSKGIKGQLLLGAIFIMLVSMPAFAQPVITNFSPASGPVGTSVTITGTGFNATPANNIVYFGATKANVTAATTTQLTVTVPVGATYQPISVLANGLIGYSSAPFATTYVGWGIVDANTFASKTDYVATYVAPLFIANGDFDGDGKTDLAVANGGYGTVSIFRNISTSPGAASYAPKVDFSTGSSVKFISVGDLDGDGKTDLAFTKFNTNTVSVFRNTSTGAGSLSFASQVDYTTGSSPYSVSIGDFDKDGKADLAVANNAGNTVSVFRNMSIAGSVSFAAKVDYATGTGPYSVSISDLDGDGKVDLGVANYSSSSVSVIRNTSTGIGSISFASKVDYAAGSNPISVSTGDLDGDGKADIAVANRVTVSILRNTSSGAGTISFSSKVDFAGTNPSFVSIGDLDGDGKADLAVANYNSNSVSVFRNTSNGAGSISYDGKVDYVTGTNTNPMSVTIGDYDGDGKADLASANSINMSVMLHQKGAWQAISSFNPIPAKSYGDAPFSLNATASSGLPIIYSSSNPSIAEVSGNSVNIVGYGTATITATQSGDSYYGPISVSQLLAVGPFPAITNFSPTSGPVGTSVTINGSGFSPTPASNTVYFGATKATVTAANATQLTVTVPVGATYQPISVVANGLVAYSNLPFATTYVGWGAMDANTFTSKTDYITGTNPISVANGDFDGDGKTDLAAVNSNSSTVSVFRNTSTGPGMASYASKMDFATGATPYSVSIGDFDGDGKIDLAVTNWGSNTVSVFRNTSTGPGAVSFAAKVDYATGSVPSSISVGDLDNDGKVDLAAVNYASSTVSILQNTSTGVGSINFAAKVDYNTGANPRSVSIGDLDGDGKGDLAIANYGSGANAISIFRNASTGMGSISFAPKVDYATGTSPCSVSIGDIDGDGKSDLAVANYNSNTISILRSTSTGAGSISFAAKVDYPTGANPNSVSIGDLDGDGKPDLAVANYGSSSLSAFRNISAGAGSVSYAAKVDYAIGTITNTQSVTIGDFNGDGKADLATANNGSATVSVILHTIGASQTISSFDPFPSKAYGDPTFSLNATASSGLPVTYSSSNPSVATVSGNMVTIVGYGTTTITATQSGDSYIGPVSVSQVLAIGPFPTITNFTPTSGPVGTTVIINGSGFSSTPTNNTVYFGATKATVTSASATQLTVTVPVGATYKPITVVTNGLIAYSQFPFSTTYPGWGMIDANSFAPKTDLTGMTAPNAVAVGDFDGDGKTDLAAVSGISAISILRNTSTAAGMVSYAPKIDFPMGTKAYDVTVGDFDGDGKLDLAATGYSTNTISVFRNTSTGAGVISFAPKVDYTTGTNPYSVSGGDLDGDGKTDLSVTNYSNNTVSVFRNTSSGVGSISFAAKVDYGTGTSPISVSIGDMDGDGKADLAVANYGISTISIFRNTSSGMGSMSFASKADLTVGPNPRSVALGDLDGDGRSDLATASWTNNTVCILPNTSISGVLSFATAINYTSGTNASGTHAFFVSAGDLDGDGKADLAVANGGGTGNTVSVFRNTCIGSGSISFAGKIDYTTGTTPYMVSIGDFDGDGKVDMVLPNYNSNTTLSVILHQINQTNIYAPTNLTTSSFTANWLSIGWATGYQLDVATDANFTNILSGYNNLSVSGASQAVTGLTPGTNYYYRVRIVNGATISLNSATASVLTLPDVPLASAINITGSDFTVIWNPITSATGYQIDVASDGAFTSFITNFSNLAVAGVSQSIPGLAAGTTYYFRVRAINASGVSASSVTGSVTTIPGVPVAIGATPVSASSFTATWSAAIGATGYQLDVATDNAFANLVSGYGNLSIGNVTTFLVTGLNSTTNYYFRVRSVNVGGASASSNIVSSGLLSIPDDVEFVALKALYLSTNGANWSKKTNWPTTWPATATAAEFGTWYGVQVVNGDVMGINLSSNNLIGTIPVEIGNLTSITSFQLQSNHLSGTIPTSVGNLNQLITLYLNSNQLSGGLPVEIGNIAGLQKLDISSNQLSGSIPTSYSNLVNLQNLYLSNNQLTGAIPDFIGGIVSLQNLNLSSNQLSGSVPSNLGNLIQLQSLQFFHNQLTGSIPSSFGSLTNLTLLNIGSNFLSGSIPTELGNLNKLIVLAINNNSLTGSLPDSFANLVKLNQLSIGVNQLSGQLPEYLGNLPLTSISASNNKFTGSIPGTIGNLVNLTSLQLNSNQLSGPIPPTIGNLTKLNYLYINNNQLSGSIPPEIGNLVKLLDIALYYNQFSGSLPEEIGDLQSLTSLSVAYNQFSGVIPVSIGRLTELRGLYLQGNQFSGPIPSTIGNLSKLNYLQLAGNQLSGNIPPEIGTMSNLVEVQLNQNQLTGPIPSSIGNLTNLVNFYAFSNRLTDIPASITQLHLLANLQVNDNDLTSIPDFTSFSNKANLSMKVQDNRLDFTQLEPLRAAGLRSLTYIGQKNINDISVINVPQGSALSIPARQLTSTTSIVWERQAGPTTWVSISSLNENTTGATFNIATPSSVNAGIYRYKLTDTAVPGLTLMCDPITVNITDAVNADGSYLGTPLYNGNITAQSWRTQEAYATGTGDYKGMYLYKYDDKYQIQEAQFANPDFTTGLFALAGNNFRELGYTYDPNGNIQTLKRYDGNGNKIHDLSYSYTANKNQLQAVTNNGSAFRNYNYNEIGQMTTQDNSTDPDQFVEYDVTGKVVDVYQNVNPDGTKGKKITHYTYDDRGFRLSKETYDASGVLQFTTWYIRDASGNVMSIYDQQANDANITLTETPIYGSGKLGMYRPKSNGGGEYVYELTDHLGNVRATMKNDQTVYLATMEDNGAADYTNPRVSELQYFTNLFETQKRDVNMNHTPDSVVHNAGNSSYLNWTSSDVTKKAIGVGITLKVEAGDQLNLEAWAKYKNAATYSRDATTAMMASLLSGAFIGANGLELTTTATTDFSNALPGMLAGTNSDMSTQPYAYLNYIVFDKDFLMQDGGAKRVPTSAGFDAGMEIAIPHQRVYFDTITVAQKGFIYVWVSNESANTQVWWDDLKVTHTGSRVTQATDYYAFGSIMREQSIATEPTYKFGYQGQFAEKDDETGWNHFELREYDPIIGRMLVPDPYRQYWSTYIGMGNNPVNSVDPDGGCVGGDCPPENPGGEVGEINNGFMWSGKEWTRFGEEVVVTAKRWTALDDAVTYWNDYGTVPYGQARNSLYGGKDGKTPLYFWFNFTDKQADCVECVMAPMQKTSVNLFEKMSTKQGDHGRNAQVGDMVNGLLKAGYSLRKTDPKRGDLIFWKKDGVYTHVAYVYSVHNSLFAIWGASSGSNQTPKIGGLYNNTPGLTVDLAGSYGFGGTGATVAGFVTLKP